MLFNREESEIIWTYVKRIYHSNPEERILIKNIKNQIRFALCRFGRDVVEVNVKLSEQEMLYLYLSFKYNILSRKETKEIRENSNYYEVHRRFCEKILIEINNGIDSSMEEEDEY